MCIPDQTKGQCLGNGMLDKDLSQIKSIMSNKGPRFSHDVNRQKKKISHLKFTWERIKKLQKNIKFKMVYSIIFEKKNKISLKVKK